MKKALIAVLVVAAILAGLFFLFKSREGAIVLAYKFKPGQVDKYKVTTKLKMDSPFGALFGSGSGKVQTETAFVTAKVTKVLPDGSAKVRLSYAGSTAASSMMSIMGPSPYGSGDGLTLTITKTGEVTNVTDLPSFGMPGMDKSMRDLLKVLLKQIGVFTKLPESKVSVGQSWAEPVRLPGKAGGMDVTYTLISDREQIDGKRVCRFDSKYDGKIDLSEFLKSTMGSASGGSNPFGEVAGDMAIDGTRVAHFSQAQGKLVRVRDKGRIEMTMVLGKKPGASAAATGAAMTIEIKLEIDSYMRLMN